MEPSSNPMRAARTYKDAIAALNTLQSNYASIQAKKNSTLSAKQRNEFSLSEVFEYIRRLGYQPQEFNKLNCIHVTGTKGKGSTCAFTDSILSQYQSKGVINKIGLFTSPHLKSVRERIRINGSPLCEQKFTKYFYEVWDKLSETVSDASQFPTLQPCEQVKPMYFKYLTILSFHVFMSEGVDTAIYEVGVGGKYDSTNVIQRPTVAAITSLGIDHTAMLGTTIESIAWNKAGIMKEGCPAIASEQPSYPESLEVLKQVAADNKVSSFEVVSADVIPADLVLGLAGEFQRSNAAVAVKAAQKHLQALGVEISLNTLPEPFKTGLEQASWDGRCQTITNLPNYEGISWFIDGAHTLESIDVASKWFKSTITSDKRQRVLIFNQQSRENAQDLLAGLYKNVHSGTEVIFDHVIFTTNITWSDGKYNSDLVSMNNSKELVEKLVIQKELAEKWAQLEKENNSGSSESHIFADLETTVSFVKGLAEKHQDVEVFVCGSLHLVGGVLTVLEGTKD